MAAAMRAFIGLAIVAALVQTALGVNYAVGGAGGWNLGSDFQTWASSQSFKTGDSICMSTYIFVLSCASKDKCIYLAIPQDASLLYQTCSHYFNL